MNMFRIHVNTVVVMGHLSMHLLNRATGVACRGGTVIMHNLLPLATLGRIMCPMTAQYVPCISTSVASAWRPE